MTDALLTLHPLLAQRGELVTYTFLRAQNRSDSPTSISPPIHSSGVVIFIPVKARFFDGVGSASVLVGVVDGDTVVEGELDGEGDSVGEGESTVVQCDSCKLSRSSPSPA